MANWYCSSVGWTAVTAWAALTAYNVGDLRRQLAAPSVGNERVFRCTTGGTSAAAEPAWTLTKGATTTENVGTTNVPVWTEVTGNETYNATTFAAPHARLQTAMKSGWPAAGDTIFVDASHAETQAASMTITGVGTVTSPLRVICIASTHSSTPVAADLATTATCTTTGNNAMLVSGSHYCYGITFSCGSTAVSTNFTLNSAGGSQQVFDNCGLTMGATSGGSLLLGSGLTSTTADITRLYNSTVTLSAAAHVLNPRGCRFAWIGGTLAGTVPTGLFGDSGLGDDGQSVIEVRDVNLNSAGTWTSKFLFNQGVVEAGYQIRFVNCKVATTLGGVVTGTNPGQGTTCDFIVSDSTANVTVREEHYGYTGSVVQDTTNFRTGGASDGTTSKAWKIVSLSTASRVFPFYCPDIYQWVNATGSKTISVYISNNSSVTAQDLDIGFEVEYLNDASSPLGTYADTRLAGALGLLSTGTNWGTDTSTWGGATTNKQVMTKTLTFNQKGAVRVRPFITKASFTVWIDPLITVA